MAKLRGPEEFFEVFHEKDSEEPQAARPAAGGPAQTTLGFNAAQKTVTIEVRTLAIAGACALLLVVLSYFVGLSRHPEAPAGGQKPVVRKIGQTPQDRRDVEPARPNDRRVGRKAGDTDDGDGVPVLQKLLVLQVATYDYTLTQRGYADDLMQYLKERRELRSSPVHIFPHVTKNKKLIVCVGPFESTRSPTARKIIAAVHSMSYRGHSFKDALFNEITLFRPRP